MKRQENLLHKCKEVMRTHKERSTQLGSENEALQQQLQERLQELEKMKVNKDTDNCQPCSYTNIQIFFTKRCKI